MKVAVVLRTAKLVLRSGPFRCHSRRMRGPTPEANHGQAGYHSSTSGDHDCLPLNIGCFSESGSRPRLLCRESLHLSQPTFPHALFLLLIPH